MPEEWRDIEGYEGRYQISSLGRVRSHKDKRRILGQDEHYKGHLCIRFYAAGRKKRKYFVHRLVAIAFISKIEGKNLVNHKDGNKKNNRVENLEWVTVQENTIHYYQSVKPYLTKNVR